MCRAPVLGFQAQGSGFLEELRAFGFFKIVHHGLGFRVSGLGLPPKP